MAESQGRFFNYEISKEYKYKKISYELMEDEKILKVSKLKTRIRF